MFPLITKGQTVTIIIDALNDLELGATVTKIIPSGDTSTHEFIVEAVLPRAGPAVSRNVW